VFVLLASGLWLICSPAEVSADLCSTLMMATTTTDYQYITLRHFVPVCIGWCNVDSAHNEQYEDTAALDRCFSQHFAVPYDLHSTNILHSCIYLSLKLYSLSN